ncbi:MAG: cytochrome c5 family protein [Rhodoferax sp.]|nr:cytochrome c5 family protein [Rhodoferax sp.]
MPAQPAISTQAAAPRRPAPGPRVRAGAKLTAVVLSAWLLGACEPRPATLASTAQRSLEASRPADAKLSEKYERACMTCHIDPAGGAPRTHDQAAWRSRASAGRDALIASVQEGRNAMPPMGLCPDCSRDDLGALIDFMRGAQP